MEKRKKITLKCCKNLQICVAQNCLQIHVDLWKLLIPNSEREMVELRLLIEVTGFIRLYLFYCYLSWGGNTIWSFFWKILLDDRGKGDVLFASKKFTELKKTADFEIHALHQNSYQITPFISLVNFCSQSSFPKLSVSTILVFYHLKFSILSILFQFYTATNLLPKIEQHYFFPQKFLR